MKAIHLMLLAICFSCVKSKSLELRGVLENMYKILERRDSSDQILASSSCYDEIGIQEECSKDVVKLKLHTVEELHEKMFIGLKRLDRIAILDKRITTIPTRTFYGLKDLKRLDLEKNKIDSIQTKAFEGTSNIENINLSENLITSEALLVKDIWYGLNNLTYLNLNDNKLTSLSAAMFEHLENLLELRLRGNQLAKVDAYSLKPTLDWLVISLNMDTIPKEMFKGLKVLTILNIEDSPSLKDIEDGAFLDLGSIQALDIVSTSLSELRTGMFSGLTSIYSLDLWDNNITHIQDGTFAGLTTLDSLTFVNKYDGDVLFEEAFGRNFGDFLEGRSKTFTLDLDDPEYFQPGTCWVRKYYRNNYDVDIWLGANINTLCP